MTAFTATQGFIYATGGDSPAATASTVATLVAQMDTKATGYDTDAARAQANNMVKISVSNLTYVASGSQIITYDTVEANRGTNTDLTVDNQNMYLSTGLWMVGAEAIWSGSSGNSAQNVIIGVTPGSDAIGYYYTESRDAGTSLNGQIAAGFTGTMQEISVCRIGLVSADNTKARGFLQFALLNDQTILINYLTAWAFKLGDL